MNVRKKILVIKMGYSETLDSEESRVVSLGDVIRCSVILEPLKSKFPGSHITWLVSEEALPLVAHNNFIDRILVWDEFVPYVLMREKYDIVINLEKIHGICALADMVDAWEKIGFRFNSQDGGFDTYMISMAAKEYIKDKDEKGIRSVWQEVILNMLGMKWEEQDYCLGYKPRTETANDVGLNYLVGSKWPTKAMSESRWQELENLLKDKGYTVSWQQGKKNLYEYMDWIHSCKTIVTSDSLGMHLAFAMGKPAVCLFGATDSSEIFLYNGSAAVSSPVNDSCPPCYSRRCRNEEFCMDSIDLKTIVKHIDSFGIK